MKNQLKTIFLLGILSAILISIGGALGPGSLYTFGALEKLERGAEIRPAEAAQPATASLFIVNPLAGGGSFLQLLSTHPPMGERVRRLRHLARTYQRVAV